MKQKLINLKVLLCMLLLQVGINAWGAIADGTYVLCTSTSDLEAGAHYIIASGIKENSTYVNCISNESNANNRKVVSAKVSDSNITVASTSTIMTFTLGGSTGAWTFSTDNYKGTNGYLASAASSNYNYCRVISTKTTGTISFSDNAAIITLQPHSSRNILRYNSVSTCFACYSSGQNAVYLYKKAVTRTDPSFSIANMTIEENSEDNVPVITTNNTDSYSVTYLSSNEEVAYADNGKIVGYGQGTCTITATMAATTNFNQAQTTFNVTVTAAKTLSSIALSGTPTKTAYTVGDNFDPAGITVTANYSDGTNENVTSSATFYGVTEALTAGQTSFETYATYKGVDSDVQNYTITVSKKTPTITIANMTIGKDEQATISATTTPAEASLTYTITEGSEYITLNGSTITGVAAGTATVRASYAGNAEYDALNKDFTVTVTNATSVDFTPNATNCANVANISVNAYLGITCGVIDNPEGSYTAPSFNTQLRIQKQNYITFQGTTGTTISKIELTYSSGSYNGKGLTASSGTYAYDDTNSKATWTGDAVNSVTLTTGTGTAYNALRITGIKIYYVPGAVQEKKLLSLILSGTQKTQYEVNETFSSEGLVVNGYYNDDTTSPIEAGDYNVTAPDMTSAGIKDVTVAVGEVSNTYPVAIYNTSVADYTLDMTTATYDANPTDAQVLWTKENITVKAEQNEGTKVTNFLPGYNGSTVTSTRLYKNNILTFTPSNATIARIVITTTTENYASALSSNEWTNAKAMAEGATVTMIPTNGANAITGTLANTTGIETIKFYYESATATITLNAACTDGSKVYGTYSNSSAFVVPANLTVSAVSVDGEGKLVVSNYSNNEVVPANTGVMVSADKWEIGTQDFKVLLTSGAGVVKSNNLLRPSGDAGITAAQMASKDANCLYYRLTMHNGKTIGFWWGAENGAAFDLAANKAYLAVPNGTNVKASFWVTDDDATVVSSVSATLDENAPVYNLSGQRVSHTTKGIVIHNGKKYLNK